MSAHHQLDQTGTVHFGDGTRRKVADLRYVVSTIAGGGSSTADGPALQANLANMEALAVGPDGSVFVARNISPSIVLRRIAPDGTIATIAGLPPTVPKVDGASALHADITSGSAIRLATGPDGSLYFTDNLGHQVWRIDPTGILRHVAGTGSAESNCAAHPRPPCGDGGLATDAYVRGPMGVSVAPDGAVYVSDSGHYRVRRIGPEGRISTYYPTAANPTAAPHLLKIRNDGTLFMFTAATEIRRVEPLGSTLVLGNADNWCGGGGSYRPVTAGDDDSIFVACYGKVLMKDAFGDVHRIAGFEDESGFSGDDGYALNARFAQLQGLSLGPNRSVFLIDKGANRIRRLTLDTPAAVNDTMRVPSEDGTEVYEFSLQGKHLRTLAATNGATLKTFAYEAGTGNLASITDAFGNATTFSRTASSVTITAPFGQVTSLGMGASGFLTSVTNPVTSEVTQLTHTTSGLLTKLVDPRGGEHRFEYEPTGRLVRDSSALPGTMGTRLVSSSVSRTAIVEVRSPEGRTSRHLIDKTVPPTKAWLAETRTVVDGAGLLSVEERYIDGSTALTKPNGDRRIVQSRAGDPLWGSLATYDNSVRLDVGYPTTTHSMTLSENRTASLGTVGDPFSATSQTITTTRSNPDPLLPSQTVTRVYTAGPPAKWTTTSAAGRKVEQTLDALGRVTKIAVLDSPIPLFPIEYHYDSRGRIDQITRGTRVYTSTFSGTTGWTTATSAPEGMGLTYDSRDANGRPLLITLPGARQVGTSYDLAGNVASVTPPSRPAHNFSSDLADRLAAYMPPDGTPSIPGRDTTYRYDDDDFLQFLGQPGTPQTIGYDAKGRLSTIRDAVTKTVQYDARGRWWKTTTSDGVTLTNTYDGSLLSQQATTGPFTHALNKTYDNYLRVKTWDIDGVSPVTIAYDGDGAVSSVGGMTVTRSADALISSITSGGVTDSFTYNGYGEVLTHTAAGVAGGYSVTYARDDAGRIASKTESIGGVTQSFDYDYDSAGRLANVYENGSATPSRSWTYDGNGNRSGGTVDNQDRLTSLGGASFTYGPNGELATRTDGGGTTSFGYDSAGNLRSVSRPPLAPITYLIDGQNRRIGRKVGGTLVQGFVYDGDRIVAELDGAGAVVARFAYASGQSTPDQMTKAGVVYRILKDQLGSPRLVVNQASGATAQQLSYDEWGNVPPGGDTSPGFQPFGFAGGLWDEDVRLLRFGARDYDPVVARWTSKDQSGFEGGENLYGYCAGDPINMLDPTGYGPIGAAVGGGVGATFGAASGFTLGGSVGLAGIAGGPTVLATVPTGAAVGAAGGLLLGGAAGAFWGDRAEEAASDWLENRRKGERNWAGKPSGTPNEEKINRRITKGKDGNYYMKDQNGQRKQVRPPKKDDGAPFFPNEDDSPCP